MLSAAMACNSDDTMENELDIDDIKASIVNLQDIADNGDPSDIQFSFSSAAMEDLISSYYVIYQPAGSPLATTPLLSELSSENSLNLTTQQSKDNVLLGSTQKSFNNQSFDKSQDYIIYVVSIAEFKEEEVIALSDPSDEFNLSKSSTFESADYEATDIVAVDMRSEGNAADITVTFSAGKNASDIDSYRIFFAKSETSVEASVAETLNENQYVTINTSNETYSIAFEAMQLDYSGVAISTDQEYSAYILTFGSFNGDPITALSEGSNVFELENPEVTTLVSGLNANDAITMDGDGNLYISNYGSYNQATFSGTGETIVKVTPAGEQSTFISGLTGPVGGVIDGDGNFFVNSGSNFVSGDLVKIDASGNATTITTIGGYPSGILLDDDNTLYVANYWGSTITQIDSDGSVSEFASDDKLFGGVGIAFDDDKNILLGNLITGEILSVAPDGSAIDSIATIPTVVSQYVIGYITYFEGYIYATGIGANLIYKVSLDGVLEVFAGNEENGTVDGELLDASFSNPNGILIDKENRVLYVSEISGNLRVIPID